MDTTPYKTLRTIAITGVVLSLLAIIFEGAGTVYDTFGFATAVGGTTGWRIVLWMLVYVIPFVIGIWALIQVIKQLSRATIALTLYSASCFAVLIVNLILYYQYLKSPRTLSVNAAGQTTEIVTFAFVAVLIGVIAVLVFRAFRRSNTSP